MCAGSGGAKRLDGGRTKSGGCRHRHFLLSLIHIWLRRLADQFAQLQFFAICPEEGYCRWGQYCWGKLRREYCAYSSSGQVLRNEGELTEAEARLNMGRFCSENPHSGERAFPTREDVMAVAEAWADNTAKDYPQTGWLCTIET